MVLSFNRHHRKGYYICCLSLAVRIIGFLLLSSVSNSFVPFVSKSSHNNDVCYLNSKLMARMANNLPLSSSSSLISLEHYIKQFRNRSINDKNDELCDAILAVSESCIEILNERMNE